MLLESLYILYTIEDITFNGFYKSHLVIFTPFPLNQPSDLMFHSGNISSSNNSLGYQLALSLSICAPSKTKDMNSHVQSYILKSYNPFETVNSERPIRSVAVAYYLQRSC